MLRHRFMPSLNEVNTLPIPCGIQSGGSCFNRSRLDIKGPHPAGRACTFGKQQGVVPVAAGGVDDMGSRCDKLPDNQVRKRNRAAQQRFIVWCAVAHGNEQ